MINNKPLTKKQRRDLIDAWAKVNSLYGFYENPTYYTNRYNPKVACKEIFKKLDSIVSVIYENDL